jgi:hypothetical protein
MYVCLYEGKTPPGFVCLNSLCLSALNFSDLSYTIRDLLYTMRVTKGSVMFLVDKAICHVS